MNRNTEKMGHIMRKPVFDQAKHERARTRDIVQYLGNEKQTMGLIILRERAADERLSVLHMVKHYVFLMTLFNWGIS